MKGWLVSDGTCWILCRAATRGRAKLFWPEYSPYDRDSFLTIKATRAPWLDGDSEEVRYVDPQYVRCDAEGDSWGGCLNPDHYLCWEGEQVDKDATFARLERQADALKQATLTSGDVPPVYSS